MYCIIVRQLHCLFPGIHCLVDNCVAWLCFLWVVSGGQLLRNHLYSLYYLVLSYWWIDSLRDLLFRIHFLVNNCVACIVKLCLMDSYGAKFVQRHESSTSTAEKQYLYQQICPYYETILWVNISFMLCCSYITLLLCALLVWPDACMKYH